MRLVQIVDSKEYLRTNCWQKQLFAYLGSQCDEHLIVTRQDIESGRRLPDGDVLLSTLKLRTILKVLEPLRDLIGQHQVHVYEQDPWCDFVDGAPYRGAYAAIGAALNVTFINTSSWWSNYIASRGHRSIFAQMWMDPTLCDPGVPWASRPITVGFMGALHPHRQRAIVELSRMGVEVQVFPSRGYDDYLTTLSQMQFFFHEEASASWTIDGRSIGQNALWAKEIEIAARGCFALRQHEDESLAYNAIDIPSILTFNALSQVPHIIEHWLGDASSSQRARTSVDFIKSHQGWFKLKDL